jgi:dihydrodipicolinate synthase/N-acetylneuraminate lyase
MKYNYEAANFFKNVAEDGCFNGKLVVYNCPDRMHVD